MKIALSLFVPLVLLVSRRAHAEEPSAADRDAAREVARRGAVYFDNGDWEKACEHFRRAYDIVRAPTLALMEGRALVELGRLVEAEDAYARAAGATTDFTNVAYRNAQIDATTELASLRARVPTLRVVVAVGGPRTEVRVDGVPRSDFASISLNPGTHSISLLREGSLEGWQRIALREGERRTVVFAEKETPSHSHAYALTWTAFGIGAAGLGTGLWTGALALDRKSTLDSACNGTSCPPEVQSDLRDYHRLRTASLIGYIVGFVGVAGGVVSLVSRQKEPAPGKVRAFISASPSGIELAGDF